MNAEEQRIHDAIVKDFGLNEYAASKIIVYNPFSPERMGEKAPGNEAPREPARD